MDRATGLTEVGQGWRNDPWQTHEYRYYSGGMATNWVSSSGVITEEVVVSVGDLLCSAREPVAPPLPLTPVLLPSHPLSDGWRNDPWQTHEYRYYSGGEATNWVSTSGLITEEVVVSIEQLLSIQTAGGRLTVAEWGGSPPSESFAPAPGEPAAFVDEDETAERTRTPVRRPCRGSAPRGTDTRGRVARRGSIAAVMIGALVLLTSLVVLTASHGDQHVQSSTHHHPAHSPSVDPTAQTAALPASSGVGQLDTWWSGAGQPDTMALVTGLQELGNPTGSSTVPTGACRTFAGAVATAAAATPAPMATIEREWQQTISTVDRVANACAAGRYAQMSEDLQPASYTIHDLTAQVTSYLDGG